MEKATLTYTVLQVDQSSIIRIFRHQGIWYIERGEYRGKIFLQEKGKGVLDF